MSARTVHVNVYINMYVQPELLVSFRDMKHVHACVCVPRVKLCILGCVSTCPNIWAHGMVSLWYWVHA